MRLPIRYPYLVRYLSSDARGDIGRCRAPGCDAGESSLFLGKRNPPEIQAHGGHCLAASAESLSLSGRDPECPAMEVQCTGCAGLSSGVLRSIGTYRDVLWFRHKLCCVFVTVSVSQYASFVSTDTHFAYERADYKIVRNLGFLSCSDVVPCCHRKRA